MKTTTAVKTYKEPTWNSSLNRWWLRIGRQHTKTGQVTIYLGGSLNTQLEIEAVQQPDDGSQFISYKPGAVTLTIKGE